MLFTFPNDTRTLRQAHHLGICLWSVSGGGGHPGDAGTACAFLLTGAAARTPAALTPGTARLLLPLDRPGLDGLVDLLLCGFLHFPPDSWKPPPNTARRGLRSSNPAGLG